MYRKIFTLLFLPILTGYYYLYAQGISPVEGYRNRDSVILGPGEWVGKHSNPSWLILGAEQGSPVVAPTDGVLIYFRFTYWHTFSEFLSWNILRRTEQEQSEQLEALANENELSLLYINATAIIASQASDITLSGFKPRYNLRVGDSIHKGDTIGTVDYFSPLIAQPSLALSFSGKLSNSELFRYLGIKKPRGHEYKFLQTRKRFSVAEIRNELDIVYDILKETTPTLYDYRSRNSFDSLYQILRAKVTLPLLYRDYLRILNKLICSIRDPNVTIRYNPLPDSLRELYLYPVLFGVLSDSLVVTHNYLDIKQLTGSRILAVDGDASQSVISFIRSQLYDEEMPYSMGGYSSELLHMNEFTRGSYIYYRWYRRNKVTHGITLSLKGGETGNYAQMPEDVGYTEEIPPSFAWYFKKLNDDTIRMRALSHNIALLSLPRLDFGALQLGEIESFIDSLTYAGCENLIIDLRYNQRGTIKNIETIFSHLTSQPFQSHLWVDMCPHSHDVLERYHATILQRFSISTHFKETSEENIVRATNTTICTPARLQYKGNLYVLTNEFTQSLGSMFAALVRKEGRGIIIGRETNSPYHIHSAPPILQYTLPYSKVVLNAPMVKLYFDTVQYPNRPKGRGVIPDLRIDYSLREFSHKVEDSILAYTIELIKKGGIPKPEEIPFWTFDKIAIAIWFSLAILLTLLIIWYTQRLGRIRAAWLQKHRDKQHV